MSDKFLGRFFYSFLYIATSIITLMSIVSYNSADRSLNVASSQEFFSNYMGKFGSYISDILIQLFGYSSFMIVLLLILLAYLSFINKNTSSIKQKTMGFALYMSSICFFFSCIAPYGNLWDFDGAGGFLGNYLFSTMSVFSYFITVPLFLIFFLLSIYIFLGLNLSSWKKIKILLKTLVVFVFKGLLLGIKFLIHIFIKKKITAPTKINKSKKINNNTSTKKQKNLIAIPINQGGYALPSLNLLMENKNTKETETVTEKEVKLLDSVLHDFGIKGQILGSRCGPVITLFEFEPIAGTKSSRIIGLSEDIARSMSAISTRIAVIPGRNAMGFEIPNKRRKIIYLRDLLESSEYQQSKLSLPIVLGTNIAGSSVIADLTKMPHLLVAGTTGSGKSVAVNAMILSILYKFTPDECKFIMIDPKMLELSVYDGIPHLLTPVVTEPKRAVYALKWVVREMEDRYRAMASMGVRNIDGYNDKIDSAKKAGKKLTRRVQTGFNSITGDPEYEDVELENKRLPYIVVIVDEMADLMITAGKDVESLIQRLAQMARAAGIHIIMATQRPSVDVITGVIKANFPTRISFQVTSRIDSRTILGEQGAEQLLGKGDMLFMAGGGRLTRAHGPFVDDKEVEDIVAFIKSQGVEPQYMDAVTADEGEINEDDNNSGSERMSTEEQLYQDAVNVVRTENKPSISFVQRQLRIGYNKAANLIERMEKEGIVTEAGRNGKREVIEN